MTFVKINARDLILEISDMAATPVWTQTGGLTEAGINYSENEETEDTTDFGDQGNYREEVMQRGASLEIKGHRLVDSVTGDSEPGQALLIIHAAKVGPASQVNVRMRYPLDEDWTVWVATVKRGTEGGGTNNKVGLEYTLTRCGAATSTVVTP